MEFLRKLFEPKPKRPAPESEPIRPTDASLRAVFGVPESGQPAPSKCVPADVPTVATITTTTNCFNLGDGCGFEMAIVGESYYGLEIQRIAGKRLANGEEVVFTVSLVREPENEYDTNAVAVIGPFGKKIGHLSRDYAREYQPLLLELEQRRIAAICSAKMFGGRGRKKSIGVWLDIELVDDLWKRVNGSDEPF